MAEQELLQNTESSDAYLTRARTGTRIWPN